MSSTLANHYICPEDLSPLPTTLDAKKSPLALLAQTCSNIGADLLPNNKPIIPPLQKPKKSLTERSESVCSSSKNNFADNRSNSVGSVDVKISFKPYETNNGNKSNKSDTSNENVSRSNSVDVIVDKKCSSSSAEQRNPSPKGAESKSASNIHHEMRGTPKSSSSSSTSSNNGSTPLHYSSSGLSELSKTQLTTFSKSDSLSTACKTTSSLVSCINGYSNYHALNASGAALLHNDIMKSSHYSSSLLSPYLNQAHAAAINSIKAASVCRDPYCKGCQISAATATALNANMSCANGCNGCVHSVHSHPLQGSFLPPSLASYSSQAANAALPSVRPLVCNWTVAGTYCGKSFASCEELLQHLKSHTNASSAPFPPLGSYYNPGGLPPSLASVSALRSAPQHSTLDSFRYHPYKLPQSAVPGNIPPSLSQGAPGHLLSLTGSPLASYYPTYNMYNGRI